MRAIRFAERAIRSATRTVASAASEDARPGHDRRERITQVVAKDADEHLAKPIVLIARKFEPFPVGDFLDDHADALRLPGNEDRKPIRLPIPRDPGGSWRTTS